MSKTIQSAKYIPLKIKSLRDESGWSQSELAKKAGVTASAISMIESGQRAPSLVVIRKISDALKVSVSELTGEPTQEEVNQETQAFFRKYQDLKDLSETDQKIVMNLARSLKERSDVKGDS